MKKILIADDNKQITTILSGYAKKEGFEPVIALDGAEALDKFLQFEHEIAVVLLDVMMPEIDGFEVCRRLRKESMVPIIMITARGEDYDKIMGLDIGADDYVIKPFSAPEVMARVRAVLRRLGAQETANAQTLAYANLYINLEKYMVQINGEEVPLTKKEIELLWTLAKNSTKVFSRDNLLDSIWGYDYFGDSRTVDSHIKRLRAKLDKCEHPLWEIKTIWGVGYRFEGHKDE
ncbi:response regulator transcription factor [uncultured Phascolarctobacterium sp.]|uniref:response regulator transcription factor n=1 Tax=uncultured Phascolarctobacterium sp. TaxID=512296 RepID=UPI0027D9C885|nr:response regulator transcription factor [uncultured Phascolarctobacterium sp.]